jgi:hypothetical protein
MAKKSDNTQIELQATEYHYTIIDGEVQVELPDFRQREPGKDNTGSQSLEVNVSPGISKEHAISALGQLIREIEASGCPDGIRWVGTDEAASLMMFRAFDKVLAAGEAIESVRKLADHGLK